MGVLHTFPPTRAHSLAAALLKRHSPQEIADAIEVLIDVLDALGGDPDLEDNNDREATDGDDKDVGWPEWDQLRAKDKRAGFARPTLAAGNGCHAMTEDDEDDDPAGNCDEDGVNTSMHVLAGRGAGCVIADEDFEEGGKLPSYGVDPTTLIDIPGHLDLDPAPDYVPSVEA